MAGGARRSTSGTTIGGRIELATPHKIVKRCLPIVVWSYPPRGMVWHNHRSNLHIENIFRPIEQAIEAAPPSQKAAASEKLRALKDEATKGSSANDTIIANQIEGLVGLAPGAASAILSTFATPVLGGIAGPVTNYVLDKIRGR
jgi:hypothetical protein